MPVSIRDIRANFGQQQQHKFMGLIQYGVVAGFEFIVSKDEHDLTCMELLSCWLDL